ncbi:MAG: hypothetical protein D6806_14690 [Deltaproteobacteria bacterium]|nr:MAG: hypothetical protein D6806_14690 [Deltaproteobacteria bacterium]
MASLVDAAMQLEAVVKRYLGKDRALESVISKMEPLFRKIYDNAVPPQHMFEKVRDAYQDIFEQYEDLEEAFDGLIDAYDEANLQRIRDSVGSKFVEHVRQKWQVRTCPICGSKDWTVPNCLFELREFSGGGLVIGGGMSVYSVVPVICESCGYSVFFSAARAGLVEANIEWPRLPPA